MQRPENSASSPRIFIDWGCSPTETSYQNYLTPLVLCLIYMLMLQVAMVVSKFKALTDSSLIAVPLCIYHFLIPLLPLARDQGFSHEGCDNRMASREDHEQMKHLGQNQVSVSPLTVCLSRACYLFSLRYGHSNLSFSGTSNSQEAL